MKFTPCDFEEIKRGRKGNNFNFLKKFLESELPIAKIEDFSCKTAKQQLGSLNTSIRNFNLTQIKTVQRGENIYLVNTILAKEFDDQ